MDSDSKHAESARAPVVVRTLHKDNDAMLLAGEVSI